MKNYLPLHQKCAAVIIYAGCVIVGGYYLFKRHKPHLEISKYNKTQILKNHVNGAEFYAVKNKKNERNHN